MLQHEDAKHWQARKLAKEWHNPSRVQKKIRLSNIGEWKLFSDGDARFGRNSSVTVITSSHKGELLRINKQDFMKHLK